MEISYISKKKTNETNAKYESKTTLTAVALQDQLMRSVGHLSLGDPFGFRKLPGHKMKNYKKTAKPTINTGLVKPQQVKKSKSQENQEYVLDPKPPPPTLAQKLGIVEKPKALLSEKEWNDVKIKSNEREDSKEPCVICKEAFSGQQQQVLLSCSHVFHRSCLEAFERFSGKKTCPMCRKEQYQTRIIHEGAKHYKIKCATLIQAQWRGYVVRCWYRKLRETVPPKDPGLRKKFYEDKLTSITERMIRSIDFDTNGFLREIDHSLEMSRDVFKNFDNMLKFISDEEWENIQLKAVERGETECPICLTALDKSGLSTENSKIVDLEDKAVTNSTNISASKTNNGANISGKIYTRKLHTNKHSADARFDFNNLQPLPSITGNIKPHLLPNVPKHKHLRLNRNENNAASSSGDNLGEHSSAYVNNSKQAHVCAASSFIKQKVLLSCSHVFHATCLQTFEELAEGERRFTCPICRSNYQKRII